MAIKIKKYITDDKGRVVEEVEGTEAEVEAYLKKTDKKRKSEQTQTQKTILHGQIMSENIDDRLSTIPDNLKTPEKKDLIKQIPVRVHLHDHTMLTAMLKKDQMPLQKFIHYCITAYLDGDPMFLKTIKNYRELDTVPHHVKEKHILSHRERANIFDELERSQKESE